MNLEIVQNIATLKKTAEQLCEAGDLTQSAESGKQALMLESKMMCEQANIHLQVVSFSLFGDDPLYSETAIFNAKVMAQVYPNWQMWLYHNKTVPEHVLQVLKTQPIRLIDVDDIGIAHWPGTFWRFHAVTEPNVARVIFRDADSLVGDREAFWVKQWMDSSFPFHVMRDWYSHTDLILAGLWGAYAPFLLPMREWVESYLQQTKNLHPTHADQQFLAQVVWPKIAPFCLTHDTIHDLPFATPIDSPKPGSHSSDALGGYKAKRLTVSVPAGVTRYQVVLTNEHQQVVMRYVRTAVDGSDVFHIPTEYYQHVESGLWKIAYLPVPQITVTTIQHAQGQ